MNTCHAHPHNGPTTFRAGVDVFVQLALDEVRPRDCHTERTAWAIIQQLPPSLRPMAVAWAVDALRCGLTTAQAEASVRAEIPYILGWKRRELLFGPAGPEGFA